MLSRETELATFLPLVNIASITTKLVPARQPTAMTWAGLGLSSSLDWSEELPRRESGHAVGWVE
jgi:hypothetical protein